MEPHGHHEHGSTYEPHWQPPHIHSYHFPPRRRKYIHQTMATTQTHVHQLYQPITYLTPTRDRPSINPYIGALAHKPHGQIFCHTQNPCTLHTYLGEPCCNPVLNPMSICKVASPSTIWTVAQNLSQNQTLHEEPLFHGSSILSPDQKFWPRLRYSTSQQVGT